MEKRKRRNYTAVKAQGAEGVHHLLRAVLLKTTATSGRQLETKIGHCDSHSLPD